MAAILMTRTFTRQLPPVVEQVAQCLFHGDIPGSRPNSLADARGIAVDLRIVQRPEFVGIDLDADRHLRQGQQDVEDLA